MRNSRQSGEGIIEEVRGGERLTLWTIERFDKRNEAITSGSSKTSFGQQCGDDRKGETVHGKPVRKVEETKVRDEGSVLNLI